MYDAIVVGGGIVGMSTAYQLISAGAKTLLIDRMDTGRATDAGAGILSAHTYSGNSHAWFDFAVEAFNHYPVLIEQLQASQNCDTGYARCGKLTVAVSEDEIAPFERAKRSAFERQKESGIPAPSDLYEVTPIEARELFPPLAHVLGAFYYRKAARVDGRLLNHALRRSAEQHGLTVKQASVDRLALNDHTVKGVVVDGETVTAAKVVISGGAWSQAFGEQLSVQIPVHPQRGQIIHLDLPGTNTAAWPIISAFREHYMVPWPDSRLVVGATRESSSGFKPHTTAAGVHETLGEALRVAPGLSHAEIREIRVGLRPLSVDTLPVLGTVPNVDNIYLATGHGASGLQLGPYSGKVVADLLLDRDPQTDITAFHVSRFLNKTA